MVKLLHAIPLAGIALMCVSGAVDAEKLYRWVDKQGKVTYQDHPPPKDAGNVEEKVLGEANIVPAHAGNDGDQDEPGERLERSERPREASRPGRRGPTPSGATPRTLPPDEIPPVVEVEDQPATVISPGGDVAGSAKPATPAGEAAAGSAASGAATAPGAVLPPLPVPVPVGP